MAKQIIILEKLSPGRFRVALWASPPAARKPFYVNAAATSAWRGASAADLTALKDGSVVESVEEVSIVGAPTLTAFQTELLARWTTFNADVQAGNPWTRYGSYYDPATGGWTLVVVA